MSWTLGNEGEQIMSAKLAGFQATDPFETQFLAYLPFPSQLEAVTDLLIGEPGSAVTAGARVYTGAGTSVAGHDVVFTLPAGHGTLSGSTTQTVATGSNGTATVSWTLPDADGTYELAAAAQYDGSELSGSPLTITGTGARGFGIGFGDEQFSLIAAGNFQMGSTNSTIDPGMGGTHSNERPVHTIAITEPFYIQKTEVTQLQWRSVMVKSQRILRLRGRLSCGASKLGRHPGFHLEAELGDPRCDLPPAHRGRVGICRSGRDDWRVRRDGKSATDGLV